MNYVLTTLRKKAEVDLIIRSTIDKVLVLRFGRVSGFTSLLLDDVLTKSSRDVSKDKEQDPRTTEVESLVFENIDDGYFLPKLPGDDPYFGEGEQWDALGFFIKYLWAFGFGFELIAAAAAVATFNKVATDFKETPYKYSIQSHEFLEEPEGSSPEVFEFNPTEVAPSWNSSVCRMKEH